MNNDHKITEITIKNIRGFEEKTLKFDNGNEILPNKINTLVAPNGYGKSSLYKAFDCIRPRSFSAGDKDKYNSLENDPSSLSIKLNTEIFTQGGERTNIEISEKFNIECINQKVSPIIKKRGGKFASAQSEINDLIIEREPKNQNFKFNIEIPNLDQNKKKVLPGKNFFKKDLAYSLSENKEDLREINTERYRKRYRNFFSSLTDFINGSSKTTRKDINQAIEKEFSSKLNKLNHLKNIHSAISNYDNLKNFGQILIICHILYLYKTTKSKEFTDWLKWSQYDVKKSKLKKLVGDINIGAFEAGLETKNGDLVIKYPEGSKLSNGEQDILVFVTQLYKILYYIDCKKPCILIIDEVFDYLDEFNIIIAKYYLNKIIAKFKKMEAKVYVLVLSHLEPKDLQALGKHKTIYLADKTCNKQTMEKIIENRDNSDWDWKNDIDKYFLHYHPECSDITQKFKDKGLEEKLGKSHNFYLFLEEEWNNLKKNDESKYDPFAVCAHLRITIEKRIYDKLAECKKDEFLDKHGTLKKIEYASENGVDVEDLWLLLAPIYNQALHSKDVDKAEHIKRKLNNTIIKEVMEKALSDKA